MVLAILLGGAAIVGVALLTARQRDRVEAHYAQVCRDHALEPTDTPLGASDAWLSQFDLLPRGDRDHSAVWGMQGPVETLGGSDVTTTCAAFEWWWWEDRQASTDGKGNHRVRWIRRSCLAAVVRLPAPWIMPRVRVEREGVFARLGPGGRGDFQVESEESNRRYDVRVRDPESAIRLFDADFQHEMLGRFDGTAFELAGDLELVVADAPGGLDVFGWGGTRRGGPGGLAGLFGRAGDRIRTDRRPCRPCRRCGCERRRCCRRCPTVAAGPGPPARPRGRTGMTAVWMVLAVVGLGGVLLARSYNRFVAQRAGIDASWPGVDVQLQRRHDLIPNLVETVQGSAAHERGVLARVSAARAAAVEADRDPQAGPTEQARHEDALTTATHRLLAVAEAYPALQAARSFRQLHAQLVETEDRIAAARRLYNLEVRAFNRRAEAVPSNLVASMFGFTRAEYFELQDTEAATPPSAQL